MITVRQQRSWRASILIGAAAAVVTVLVISPPSPTAHQAAAATDGACPNTATVTVSGGTTTTTAVTTASSTAAPTTSTTLPSGAYGGTAGTNIALPNTPSCETVSVSGGEFSGLQLTVNQTQGLVNQVVSVTWSGAPVSDPQGATNISDNYLQMMQCWGDDGTGAGPPPERCEFGAEAGGVIQNGNASPRFGPKFNAYPVDAYTDAFTRALSNESWTCDPDGPAACQSYDQLQQLATTDPSKATYDSADAKVWDPFDAVPSACNQDLGTACAAIPETVDEHCCETPPPWVLPNGDQASFDTNPYFSHNTTNEVDFARTYPAGTGQAFFTVDTGLQAPGLGCGQAQTNADGSTGPPPDCWLVIVPRATAGYENPPEAPGSDVQTGPLAPGPWAGRIAIKLGFQPVGSSCAQTGSPSLISGGELAASAVASWQPVLCGQAGGSSYDYIALGDDSARTQLVSGRAGMAVITRPVDPTQVQPGNPLVYAPLTLSGLTIAFNIQRVPQFNPRVPPDEVPYIGTHLIHINLTPRLVAKLLTESYGSAFGPFGMPASDTWGATNPKSLFNDPDFLQYNPEFKELLTDYFVNASQVIVEQPSSDAAYELWQWIMNDKAAAAWLSGQPDKWGMQVNPYYSTVASTNPTGNAFDSPAIDNIPQNDPYTYTPAGPDYEVGNPAQEARPLHFQDWDPYALSLRAIAGDLAQANAGSHTTFDPGAPNADEAWSADGPQTDQAHTMLGVTDTDQGALFGLQVASLSQDNDDGSAPTFVAPDTAGLTAGVGAMRASTDVPNVLVPNPTTTASGAYPLTMLTYAAVAPVGLAPSARTSFSDFVQYAAGAGQTPGLAQGSLPEGYVPLPSALVAQAAAAAATIADPSSLETTTTTTPETTTSAAPPPSTTTTVVKKASTTTTSAPTAPAATAAPAPAPQPVVESPSPQSESAAPSGFAGTSPPTVAHTAVTMGASPVVDLPVAASSGPVARTPGAGAGLSRFAFLIALLVGLAAAGTSQFLIFRR